MTTTWRCPRLSAPRDVTLTARQADVLAGICAGYTNARIAADLGIVEGSVKTHIKRIAAVLSARSRAHAAALAASGQVTIVVQNRRNP